jgi:hypothetical protein
MIETVSRADFQCLQPVVGKKSVRAFVGGRNERGVKIDLGRYTPRTVIGPDEVGCDAERLTPEEADRGTRSSGEQVVTARMMKPRCSTYCIRALLP